MEVTHSIVRRERMGHIELAAPIAHIWFLRGIPSKIGTVLDLSVQALEKVIYFASFILTDVNEAALQQTKEQVEQEYKAKRKMIEGEFKRDAERLAGKQAAEGVVPEAVVEEEPKKSKAKKPKKEPKTKIKESYTGELGHLEEIRDRKLAELEEDFAGVEEDLKELKPFKIISEQTYHDWSLRYGHIFEAAIGAEAVKELLDRINVTETIKLLEEELDGASAAKRDRIMRRLKLLKSLEKNVINPGWMILDALTVIPPDLRPMVPLDGGRFATSDLNALYRPVINRNNRLNRLQ